MRKAEAYAAAGGVATQWRDADFVADDVDGDGASDGLLRAADGDAALPSVQRRLRFAMEKLRKVGNVSYVFRHVTSRARMAIIHRFEYRLNARVCCVLYVAFIRGGV